MSIQLPNWNANAPFIVDGQLNRANNVLAINASLGELDLIKANNANPRFTGIATFSGTVNATGNNTSGETLIIGGSSASSTGRTSANVWFSNIGQTTGHWRGLGGQVSDNDQWVIRGFNRAIGDAGTAADNGAGGLEIATGDDGNEPIIFRQYGVGSHLNPLTVNPSTLTEGNTDARSRVRTLTLMDENGNSQFPGSITANRVISNPTPSSWSNLFLNASAYNVPQTNISNHAMGVLSWRNPGGDGYSLSFVNNNTNDAVIRFTPNQDFQAGGTITGTPSNVMTFSAGRVVLNAAGNITSNGTISCNTLRLSSDRRLKDNIKSYKSYKSILDLDVKEFIWKDSGKKSIGVIAQELREVFPELVSGDEKDGYLTIEETKLIYPLIAEVKRLREEMDTLKGKK